ncbi:MAG: IstB-like ATP binding protein, partial [Anaerolineales bacterium]|nr:IstB-like ATP binding protein [Anaerolineales bacterium]
ELAELDFLERGESVVFVGKAGVGKSGLASAILFQGTRQTIEVTQSAQNSFNRS